MIRTIYRGYDITEENGRWIVYDPMHSGKVLASFDQETEAQDFVDKRKRCIG